LVGPHACTVVYLISGLGRVVTDVILPQEWMYFLGFKEMSAI
jgi:hypothetical protein